MLLNMLLVIASMHSLEKITRLEAENRQLKEEQCSQAAEQVIQLENALDDVTRVKVSLESVRHSDSAALCQYLTTRRSWTVVSSRNTEQRHARSKSYVMQLQGRTAKSGC
jgi:hypothetical protein